MQTVCAGIPFARAKTMAETAGIHGMADKGEDMEIKQLGVGVLRRRRLVV